jgi:hypothetical protein
MAHPLNINTTAAIRLARDGKRFDLGVPTPAIEFANSYTTTGRHGKEICALSPPLRCPLSRWRQPFL